LLARLRIKVLQRILIAARVPGFGHASRFAEVNWTCQPAREFR
jgi:hypothetical protein